ncbi:hypothetical protein GCM10009827_010320 [Dactylosporangium maewongense]|uniref:Uncharacterized protein n=1 Tax=Dactylosporangium maewongense TaxID=634393 RepID=A0ABN1ZN28_9ACTN
MGLHCGYLVATAEPAALLEELSRHAGEFATGAVVDRTADADADEFGLLLGGGDGRAFLVDASMMLSDAADMIIEMSKALGTVVGAGAETVSGSYWLTVARDGDLVRHAFMSFAGLTLGMAIGEPLPCEEEFPLVDSSGDGVFAAMAEFGLDPSAWLSSGPATVVAFDATRLPAGGHVAEIRREHTERHGRPDGEWLHELVAVEAKQSRRAVSG